MVLTSKHGTMQDFDLELEEIIEFGTMTMEDNSISCVCIL